MSEAFRSTRGSERQFSVVPGQRFGRLRVVVETRMERADGQIMWAAECECDCGERTTVALNNLKAGGVLSCGCLQKERAAMSNSARATHALSDHEHYPRWRNMLSRCENPDNPRYPRWGGRGISVCPEWHDPAIFVAYLEEVLGPRPDGYSLDRIDNDGPYAPGNVRWADDLTQRNNQRRCTP